MNARQFDICRVIGLRAGSAVDFAVVLQDDTLSHLAIRIVAPLIAVEGEFDVERTTPVVEIDATRYIVAVHLLATVPVRNLGTFVGSLKDREREIKNALDLLFFGV